MIPRLIYILIAVCFVQLGYAQNSTQLINYQGAVRNPDGTPLGNRNISLRLSIINDNAAGQTEYYEVWKVRTNALGLYQVQIGSPAAIASGPILFTKIDWSRKMKFFKVEIDPDGGSDFARVLGVTQFTSVPYAQYASVAESTRELTLGKENDVLVTQNGKATWVSLTVFQSSFADNSTIIGKGTSADPFKVGQIGTDQLKDGAVTTPKIEPGDEGQVLTTVVENGIKKTKWDHNLKTGNVWVKLTQSSADPTIQVPELPKDPSQILVYRNGVQLLGKEKTTSIKSTTYDVEKGSITIKTAGFLGDDGVVKNQLSAGDVIEIKWVN